MNTFRFPHRSARRRPTLLLVLMLTALLGACSGAPKLHFALTDVSGHLPDLAFQLTDDHGKAVSAADFHGKVTLLYFGYTHCPDVCPTTMVHMHAVMRRLGKQAEGARLLFVSVDPPRDTPSVLHAYVNAFDKRFVGLTGTPAQIRALAKRFRVAFGRGPTLAGGGYEVNHSSAIYVFDREGHVRVLFTPADSDDSLVHDLHLLLAPGN